MLETLCAAVAAWFLAKRAARKSNSVALLCENITKLADNALAELDSAVCKLEKSNAAKLAEYRARRAARKNS